MELAPQHGHQWFRKWEQPRRKIVDCKEIKFKDFQKILREIVIIAVVGARHVSCLFKGKPPDKNV